MTFLASFAQESQVSFAIDLVVLFVARLLINQLYFFEFQVVAIDKSPQSGIVEAILVDSYLLFLVGARNRLR